MCDETVIPEDEYKEMEKAERRANRILKKNNYRCQKLKCCETCKKSSQGYPEEGRTCDLAEQPSWMFGGVSDLGICDQYEGDD